MMELMLPSFLVDHFDIVKVEGLDFIHIYLEEQDKLPEDYSEKDLISHGFLVL